MMEHATIDERCELCGLTPVVQNLRGSSRVVAESAAMQNALRRAGAFARAAAPVMILGESGSGKEVVARALHGSSPRAGQPFVAVNVAALPAELLESELFGHVRGAFTGATTAKEGLFQAAHGGTLFLDEIGEMPLPLQAKLLRVLQDGEVRRVGDVRSTAVDVRVVCATHRDLADQVARGVFREDLFYRLKVLTLRVPPLRDRTEDVLPLARLFLADRAQNDGPALRFSAAATRLLQTHRWPGNVRELANAVEHGAALARDGLIELDDLPEEIVAAASGASPARASAPSTARDLRPLAEVEREHVLRVLEACGGSQVEAARVLGIARNTLWRKLKDAR